MTDIIQPVAEQPTAEQIAKHYAAALDSVALINGSKTEGMEDAEWADTVARNKEHLKIMLAKDFWTTENLKPLQDASK
jgi:F0F1-type ATP synthase delta subunit